MGDISKPHNWAKYFLGRNIGQLLHAVDIQGLATESAAANHQLVVGFAKSATTLAAATASSEKP